MLKTITLREAFFQAGMFGLAIHNILQGDWLDLSFLVLIDAPALSDLIGRVWKSEVRA